MNAGVDTDFLVAVEVVEHPFHRGARARLAELLDTGVRLALVPQTLVEFMHVVTDARRLPEPLTAGRALERARRWWEAAEVVQVFPDQRSTALYFQWMKQHKLGRKRLLDTMLAATLHGHGIGKIISNNTRDFAVFGCFEMVGFAGGD